MSVRIGGSLLVLADAAGAPAFAQADFTGTWGARYQEDFPERIPGPDLGDYLGLPINASARQFADSWDPSRITLPEEQCRVHVSPYIYRGPLNLRIWEDRDPDTQELVAIKHHISTYDQTRTIYMDGRPHPSEIAAHTWKGFSTGKWLGDMLVVDTTHIKQGWIRRNGLPMSDQATLTEFFVRNGDVLTRISITKDPVYLTEPLVKSEDFVLAGRSLRRRRTSSTSAIRSSKSRTGRKASCRRISSARTRSTRSSRIASSCPTVAIKGGAETMYPEFIDKMKQAPR